MKYLQKTKNPYYVMAFLILILFVNSCGDEDTKFSSSDSTPSVVSTIPVDGAKGVSVSTSISITLNQAETSFSVYANSEDNQCYGNIQLSSDEFVTCIKMAGQPTIDTAKKIFTVKPLNDLTLNETYKIKYSHQNGVVYVSTMGFITGVIGFTISTISGNTTEAGGIVNFTVKLASKPTANVTIGVSSSDTTEGTVSPSSLTFTPVNWDTTQEVSLTGVDDSIIDGNQSYTIILAAAVSDDSDYNDLDPNDVTAINENNEPSQLPDSGQTICYDGTGGTITCPAADGALAQDGSYPINLPVYNDNGNGTITDYNIGLTWQKEDDDVAKDWSSASSYCESLILGGAMDWRLPNIKELQSIVNFETSYPAIDPAFFPNTKSLNTTAYWSSTTFVEDATNAWLVPFHSGFVWNNSGGNNCYVRCVRGISEATVWSLDFSAIDSDLVIHNSTGLIWQREDDDTIKTWEAALSHCESLSLGGFSDWRVPHIKELLSIVDFSRLFVSINQTYFPNTKPDGYWSSTTYVMDTAKTFFVRFDYGSAIDTDKVDNHYVRCVRGGQ